MASSIARLSVALFPFIIIPIFYIYYSLPFLAFSVFGLIIFVSTFRLNETLNKDLDE